MVRRFTLSVDDALGEKIDEYKAKFNLSEIFRKAMTSEVEKIEGVKRSATEGADMEAIIERLKAEKAEMESEAYQLGLDAGKEWALGAHYEQLVYAANEFKPWDVNYDLSWHGNNMFNDEFLGEYFSEAMPESSEFRGLEGATVIPAAGIKWINGWTDAVQAFWEEVSDKI